MAEEEEMVEEEIIEEDEEGEGKFLLKIREYCRGFCRAYCRRSGKLGIRIY